MADKEVYYDQYCNVCENRDLDEGEDPCNSCLNYPCNVDSHKPVMFKPNANWSQNSQAREKNTLFYEEK